MNEFDKWRDGYESMTSDEQASYYNDLEIRYPDQAHYRIDWVRQAIKKVPTTPIRVMEFGCWKGDLALQILSSTQNIIRWAGIEICDNAIKKTKCKDSRFFYIRPKEFDWWNHMDKPTFDIIIATHFIEHLSDEHFKQLVEFCSGIPVIYFEAPLSKHGQEWTGYEGTHKLSYGWDKVTELMTKAGYKLEKDNGDGKIYTL